jgi:hypothetical protein
MKSSSIQPIQTNASQGFQACIYKKKLREISCPTKKEKKRKERSHNVIKDATLVQSELFRKDATRIFAAPKYSKTSNFERSILSVPEGPHKHLDLIQPSQQWPS